MLIQNIASFLPSIVPGLERVQGASTVLTAQVGPRNSSKPSRALQTTPISLEFRVDDTVSYIKIALYNYNDIIAIAHYVH